jgi:hypothetical protein
LQFIFKKNKKNMKTVGLKIEIEGLSDITKQVVQLETELKDLNAQLDNTEKGSDAYIDLRNQIAQTKEQLKAANKEQKDFIKSAEATKSAEGSYYALNQELVDLKKAYKNLSAAERDSAKGDELKKKIQGLDTELKKIDAGIGQFQRNVGNYPKGIGRIVKGLEQVIPGFDQFSKSLQNANGKLNIFGKALIGGFVAFQGAKLIGQAVKALDEFVSKINETRETVAEFSGAYGEDLDSITASTTALATTFDTDAKQIAEAAQALSKQLGIGFEDALGKLEGALVEGRGNANDYLSTIAEYPEAFKEAGSEVTQFSERNRQLLDTNKELAASQVDVAKRLTGVTDGLKQAGNAIYTGLFLVLAQLIDLFKPVGAAFSKLGAAVSGLFGSFKAAGDEASTFSKIIQLTLVRPFQILAGILQVGADVLTFFVNGLKSIIEQSPFLQAVFKRISDFANSVNEGFTNLPATFAGVIEALKQLGTNFVNFFKTLSLDAQIFGNQIKEFFGANVDAAIAELKRRRAEITDESRTVGQAFADGFNKAKATADKAAAEEARKNAEIEAAKARQAAATESNKDLKARAEKQREAAKKLQADREKYAEDELKQAQSRAALLADLQAKVIDATIANIQDARKRETDAIENSFEDQKKAYQNGYNQLVTEGQKREAELIELFGKNSKEVAAAREALAQDLIAIQEQQNAIIVQLEATKNAEIAKVNESYKQEEIEKAQALSEQLKAFRDEALTSELDYIQQVGDLKQQAAQEQLNKTLASESDASKRIAAEKLAAEQELISKIETLRQQLRAVEDQDAFLKSQAALGVQIKEDEYAAVLKARQELNTQLSELELQQTENIRAEADKQKAIRQGQIDSVVSYTEQGLELLSSVIESVNARQEAVIEEQLNASNARQEQLSSEIENATGLRKKFLQQQLDNEIAAAEKLAKEQEKIQRNAAKVDKGIALTQSIIQGFLAVSRAVASAPPPLNIPAIVAATIQAGVQTAAIAAQPLAEGGAVQPVILPDSGGRVVGATNIPTTSRGDNVLVAARVGETFLNSKQTARLKPYLSAARVPGFASGGLIGGVSTVPNLTGITSGGAETIRAFNERTEAIKEQVLRTKVILVTDDLSRDNENKDRIEKRARLE